MADAAYNAAARPTAEAARASRSEDNAMFAKMETKERKRRARHDEAMAALRRLSDTNAKLVFKDGETRAWNEALRRIRKAARAKAAAEARAVARAIAAAQKKSKRGPGPSKEV